MDDRKKFWETNKHLLSRDRVLTTVLSYNKKNETDTLFQDIKPITIDNVEIINKTEEPTTKFYLFNNTLSEVISETFNATQDFVCFYKVSSTHINDQFNNAIETEESDIGLRTNLSHGYLNCPEKANEISYISAKEIKFLHTKDTVYYFDHNGNKIQPQKGLYFYGFNYPKYDTGTRDGIEIYGDKSNTLELIQVIDHMFRICTEKSKSTIIIGEIFRNCPINLVVYYLREISKKYMFVLRVFICFQKNYNMEQYNAFKKIETDR